MNNADENGLILNSDGSVRECPSNVAKMGYVKTYREFCSYKRSWDRGPMDWREWLQCCVGVLIPFIFLPLLPLLPFITCFMYVRKSRKQVAEEEKYRCK